MVGNQTCLRKMWASKTFISHKADAKALAAQVRDELGQFGFDAFVAHEDIEPTKEWEKEILSALEEMELMIPLLTNSFRSSDWTGQEIGFAIAREVPIIPIRLDSDPFGFIARIQALSKSSESIDGLGREIFELLLSNERTVLRKLGNEAYVRAVSGADSYKEANQFAKYLGVVHDLLPDQIESLVAAFNCNSQLQGATRVSEKYHPLFETDHRA